MYENTLSVPCDNAYLLDYISSELADTFRTIDAVTQTAESNGRKYMSYACADLYRHVLADKVSDAVADVLSSAYKNKYMRGLLGVSNGSFLQNVLVNVICVYDSLPDRVVVKKCIDAERPLYLDGYYNFVLAPLKRKWSELSELVGANRYVLDDESLIVEFLQYLVDSSDEKCGKLSVLFHQDEYFLFDNDNALSATFSTLCKEATAEEEAMVNLVCRRPTKVAVYSQTKPSQEFCTLCEALFMTNYVVVK